MPSLSVIIPTHKRPAILSECLKHLEKQTIAKDLEIIVVSDGHDSASQQVANGKWPAFAQATAGKQLAVKYFEIPKSQQGQARNEGVTHATAPLVLFIGDDIFLAKDACEKHVNAQDRRSQLLAGRSQPRADEGWPTANCQFATLGFTTWDPAVGITPVMRWLERTGWQFGYPKITKYAGKFLPRNIQHRYTYTSHISLPTDIARAHPFPHVTLYGWEDIEWGVRLRNAGVPLLYEPRAKALHHHRITLEDSLKRMETLGRSLPEISRMNPDLDRMPRGWKLFAYETIAMTPTLRGKHYRAFLRGLTSA